MLIGNIRSIVTDNYASLVHEAKGTGKYAKSKVFLIFLLLPSVFGVFIGYTVPVWQGFISPMFPALGVLTGFSINMLVLLTGHSEEDSYNLKTEVVEQTQDFTLYSILNGVVLIAALIAAMVIMRGVLGSNQVFGLVPVEVVMVGISILIYSLLVHYILVLVVMTHRLHSLVNIKALD